MPDCSPCFRAAAGVLLILVSIAGVGAADSAKEDDKQQAIEFDPSLSWLNVARPLTLKDLRGKIVILDFWTYGCVNCIHVMDELRKLEDKYGHPLAVIGVHSPKFDNEKNLETLRNVVVRYDRNHPVVHDPDWILMRSYGVRAWPTLAVIDPRGKVLGGVRGEGHYDLLDAVTEELLEKHEDIIDATPLPIALEKKNFENSLLAAPGKIAVSKRHVAISDTLHHRVIVTDHEGKIETIFGGPDAGLRDGNAVTARYRFPQGLVFSEQGIYVADTGNHVIRFIDLSTNEVRTVAGNGEMELHLRGEFDALEIGLRSPWGLALREPWLYIAMAGNHQIWRLNVETGKLGRYAGSGREGIADGSLTAAEFSQPSGLSLRGDWLYVADAEDSAVRRIDLVEGQVETLVGKGLFDFGDQDGSFEDAMLQHVLGVAVLDDSEVLIADTYNHKLKRLNLAKRTVETLAGTGEPGLGDGAGPKAQMNEPGGLAVLGNRVFVADTNNHRIVWYDLDSEKLGEWVLAP